MNRKEPIISDIETIKVDEKRIKPIQNRSRNKTPKLKIGTLLIVAVIAVVVFLRSSIVDIVRIADRHMEPNLYRDDFIIVDKTSFGVRLPITHTLLLETGQPIRGDIILHRLKWEEDRLFLNRVVGLPGDEIGYDNKKKVLTINGSVIQKALLGKYEKGRNVYKEQYKDLSLDIIDSTFPIKWRDDDWLASGAQKIPDNKYFVMTDDRSFCCDSRNWGLVDYEDLIGKARITDIRFFSSASGSHSPARSAKLIYHKL